MNCPYSDYITEAYLSGELEDPQWKAHLAICSICAGRISAETEFDRVLKHALTEQPVQSKALEARVHRAIRGSRFHMPKPAVFQYAAAAMFLFGVLAIATGGYVRGQVDRSAICVDAADDHREEIIDKSPRRWRSDPGEIALLSKARLGDSEIPDRIAPAGYHVTAGKICFLHGKRYIHLVYSNGSDRISVFVRRSDSDQQPWAARALDVFRSRRAQAETIDGLSIGSVQAHELMIVLVSPGSHEQVLSVVRQTAKQL